MRLKALLPKTTEGRYLAVAVFFLALLAAMTFIVWKHPDMAGLQPDSEQQTYWLIAGVCITGCALLASLLLLLAVRSAGKTEFDDLVDGTNGDDEKKKRETEKVAVHPAGAMCNTLRRHLHSRFGFFWHRKVRLLLISGINTRLEQSARIIQRTPDEVLPALVLAATWFDNAARDADIIRRNAITHPGFVPVIPLKVPVQ